MKRIKILGIVGVLFLIALWRFHSIGKPLDLYKSLKITEETGQFFSFEEPWQDIQYINYNLQSITNMWKANEGQTYTIYNFVYNNPGEFVADIVTSINGTYLQYVVEEQRTKPTNQSGWDILQNVGETVKFGWQSFIFVGRLIADVFMSIIRAIYGVAKILTGILFR